MLVILSGLPGVGKTAIARELARQLGALHLRVDSIEQALRDSATQDLDPKDVGYRVAYAVAEDNLRVGHTVIADSVNPIDITRNAWLEVAKRAHVRAIEVEVRCSDPNEHRRRVEMRVTDIPGLKLPNWSDVVAREYHEWRREHVVIETSGRSIEQNLQVIGEVLSAG